VRLEEVKIDFEEEMLRHTQKVVDRVAAALRLRFGRQVEPLNILCGPDTDDETGEPVIKGLVLKAGVSAGVASRISETLEREFASTKNFASRISRNLGVMEWQLEVSVGGQTRKIFVRFMPGVSLPTGAEIGVIWIPITGVVSGKGKRQ